MLALIAGMVNVVGLLGFEQSPITHLTASTSRLSIALLRHDHEMIQLTAGLLGSFFAGAVFSGWLIKSSTLQLGRRYGLALAMETLLLALATLLLMQNREAGVFLACAAAGLQNAMASTYSGAILRTTHMTGIITDLGVVCGQALRGMAFDWRRMLLCITLISGFFLGGLAGVLTYEKHGNAAMWIPTSIAGFSSLLFGLFKFSKQHTHHPTEHVSAP